MLGLTLRVAVDNHVICVPFERTVRMFPVHPPIERIMHEEVGEQRRNRRTLWGSPLSCDEGPVWALHRGLQPPFDVEQYPSFVGVVSDRFQQQIMRNAVEEGPDIKIEYPVLSPTT